jgi:hypothetical protein
MDIPKSAYAVIESGTAGTDVTVLANVASKISVVTNIRLVNANSAPITVNSVKITDGVNRLSVIIPTLTLIAFEAIDDDVTRAIGTPTDAHEIVVNADEYLNVEVSYLEI